MKNGRLNQISLKILKVFQRKNKKTLENAFNFEKELPKLRQTFWTEILPVFVKDVLFRTGIAKKSLKKIKALKDKTSFEKILLPIESSAKKAISEQKETLKFLKYYR